MYGLGGAEKGKILKNISFSSNFEGVKGAMSNLAPAAIERAGPVGRGKGEGKPPPRGIV